MCCHAGCMSLIVLMCTCAHCFVICLHLAILQWFWLTSTEGNSLAAKTTAWLLRQAASLGLQRGCNVESAELFEIWCATAIISESRQAVLKTRCFMFKLCQNCSGVLAAFNAHAQPCIAASAECANDNTDAPGILTSSRMDE